MIKRIGKIELVLGWLLAAVAAYAQPVDTTSIGVDTSVTATYQPKATFDNFKLLKQETATLGIGNNIACQNYYGIFYMCEFPAYALGTQTGSGRKCNIQYKISGNDSLRANLILMNAELHNPDFATQTCDLFIDIARKTLNMLGEPIPDGLRSAVTNRTDYKVRTARGYVVRLKVFHSGFDALELKIDATGME